MGEEGSGGVVGGMGWWSEEEGGSVINYSFLFLRHTGGSQMLNVFSALRAVSCYFPFLHRTRVLSGCHFLRVSRLIMISFPPPHTGVE